MCLPALLILCNAQWRLCSMLLPMVVSTSYTNARNTTAVVQGLKKYFAEAGFKLVYADDDGTPVSDGFFFTAKYKDMDSETLQRELMRHGISTISLPGTGSTMHGLRICVSKLTDDDHFDSLRQRLNAFCYEHH